MNEYVTKKIVFRNAKGQNLVSIGISSNVQPSVLVTDTLASHDIDGLASPSFESTTIRESSVDDSSI